MRWDLDKGNLLNMFSTLYNSLAEMIKNIRYLGKSRPKEATGKVLPFKRPQKREVAHTFTLGGLHEALEAALEELDPDLLIGFMADQKLRPISSVGYTDHYADSPVIIVLS